jgi:hypothetical protein
MLFSWNARPGQSAYTSPAAMSRSPGSWPASSPHCPRMPGLPATARPMWLPRFSCLAIRARVSRRLLLRPQSGPAPLVSGFCPQRAAPANLCRPSRQATPQRRGPLGRPLTRLAGSPLQCGRKAAVARSCRRSAAPSVPVGRPPGGLHRSWSSPSSVPVSAAWGPGHRICPDIHRRGPAPESAPGGALVHTLVRALARQPGIKDGPESASVRLCREQSADQGAGQGVHRRD